MPANQIVKCDACHGKYMACCTSMLPSPPSRPNAPSSLPTGAPPASRLASTTSHPWWCQVEI
ncbi:unnamed protein product [Oncorhynchus mykiss]|uniref:Uncharacterized protein n=1 Tax=Oncorhynchus mykiss TaxID=8022 RepID=A0A060YE42_ONCMY|nr:unnamed protein product [Oncorhynchus mykiss]